MLCPPCSGQLWGSSRYVGYHWHHVTGFPVEHDCHVKHVRPATSTGSVVFPQVLSQRMTYSDLRAVSIGESRSFSFWYMSDAVGVSLHWPWNHPHPTIAIPRNTSERRHVIFDVNHAPSECQTIKTFDRSIQYVCVTSSMIASMKVILSSALQERVPPPASSHAG